MYNFVYFYVPLCIYIIFHKNRLSYRCLKTSKPCFLKFNIPYILFHFQHNISWLWAQGILVIWYQEFLAPKNSAPSRALPSKGVGCIIMESKGSYLRWLDVHVNVSEWICVCVWHFTVQNWRELGRKNGRLYRSGARDQGPGSGIGYPYTTSENSKFKGA